jgi:hypothetical protein
MNTNIKQVAGLLQSYGNNGDTVLAHITPEEAQLLKDLGGAGTINPDTGLIEFGFGSFISGALGGVGDLLGGAADIVGGAVGSVGNAVGSFVNNPLDFFGNVIQGIGDDPLKAIGTLAATYFGAPYLSQAFGAGSLGASAAADAAFIAQDAASLAAQGLSSAQIASTLQASGVGALAAADAAGLAAQGLGFSDIASNLGQYGSSELFTPAALKAATGTSEFAKLLKNTQGATKLLGGLSGGQNTQLLGSGALPSQQSADLGGRGAVDYSGLLSLLQTEAKRPDILNLLG